MFRYYAVIKPLQLGNIQKRGKIMLVGAWMSAVVCSTPQVMGKLILHFFLHVRYEINLGMNMNRNVERSMNIY